MVSSNVKMGIVGLLVLGLLILLMAIHYMNDINVLKRDKQTLVIEMNKLADKVIEMNKLADKILAAKQAKINNIKSYITTNYKRVPIKLAGDITENIIKLCEKHEIPHSLVVGMIAVESSFNPMAVSSKKARGLMQVRFGVWKKELKLENEFQLHEIDTGIESGILVLKHYLEKNGGDVYNALFRYAGKSNKYVCKVMTSVIKFMMYDEENMCHG